MQCVMDVWLCVFHCFVQEASCVSSIPGGSGQLSVARRWTAPMHSLLGVRSACTLCVIAQSVVLQVEHLPQAQGGAIRAMEGCMEVTVVQ